MFSRAAAARANAHALRRAAARRSGIRFQSSSTGSSASYGSSHVAAGLAGGITVALAGYVWYHTSGLKTVVQTSKDVKSYVQTARDSVVAKASETAENPSQALSYLRGVAKQYAAFIPGAASYVDSTFDELDALHGEHGGEMDGILKETMDELSKAVSEGGANTKTAARVYEIIGRSVGKMQELGKKVGGDILEKSSAIKEKLGSGYGQLKSLAEKAGPEGKKVMDELSKQLKEISSNGLNEESLQKARQLLQDKTGQLGKLAESSGGAALDGGSDKLQALLSSVPGGEELKEKAPHLKDIISLANDRSEEAKKLAKETFQDVLNVLEEKGRKAKELSEKNKDDAGKKAKK
ncbi:hypothetical protein DFH11DRAFT_1562416 [Phellopilus nigrolimitatus]|nr:hypothetical protein DFH11DRAFT_1562416 [Phellopilus nigrolimitatus]